MNNVARYITDGANGKRKLKETVDYQEVTDVARGTKGRRVRVQEKPHIL